MLFAAPLIITLATAAPALLPEVSPRLGAPATETAMLPMDGIDPIITGPVPGKTGAAQAEVTTEPAPRYRAMRYVLPTLQPMPR